MDGMLGNNAKRLAKSREGGGRERMCVEILFCPELRGMRVGHGDWGRGGGGVVLSHKKYLCR